MLIESKVMMISFRLLKAVYRVTTRRTSINSFFAFATYPLSFKLSLAFVECLTVHVGFLGISFL